MQQQTKGCPSTTHPYAKWGSHKIYAHRTPGLPRPSASSTTGTSFSMAHEGPAVHWYIMRAWLWIHLQLQVGPHQDQAEWKNYHEGKTRRGHKPLHVKINPAKVTNDGVHKPWQIFFRERLRLQIKKHIGELPPHILLDPHSFWMGKFNHKNFFTSWPGLSLDLVHKHLTKKQSTILGHLQKLRKGLRPTKEKVTNSEPDPEQDQFPQSTQSVITNLVFFKTVDLSGKIYTDQTGRIPVSSSKGNTYILVA